MGLNIVSNNADFTPWVKYNAKAGRWYIKGENGDQEVQNPVFVADFDNIKTGWLLFLEGQAPSQIWDENLSTPAAKPSDKHKRGFALSLFSKQSFGGVVELSSSSMHICNSINDLYIQYEAGKPSNPGQLPVVKFTGSSAQKDKMGTNYKPNFVIEKWVPRPAEFDAVETQAAPQASAPVAPQPAPAAQPSVSEF